MKKGSHTVRKAKVWTTVTFRRPSSLTQRRKPKAVVSAVKRQNTFDKFAVIKHPLSTESAIKNIEDSNTLVFIVHKRANKSLIKKACKELYNINVKKVNTLITPLGEKKAYVCVNKDQEALEIANKIGIM